jgi:hypothetical protein
MSQMILAEQITLLLPAPLGKGRGNAELIAQLKKGDTHGTGTDSTLLGNGAEFNFF